MSGSAIADAAGSGKMMQNMMTKDGKYTPSYAAALTAVTAVIGPIIPPSIPMVLYALVSDASIGYLFLGGVVPGLLMAGVMMLQVAVTARIKNFPVEEPMPLRELPRHHLGGAAGAADAGGADRAASMAASRRRPKRPPSPPPMRCSSRWCSIAASASAISTARCWLSAKHHGLDRHADRRRAGVQLRRHHREHPRTISATLLAWDLDPVTFLIARQHPAAGARLRARGHDHPAGDRAGADPDGAGARHRHGAFRRGRGGQHHARADHAALWAAALHHDANRRRADAGASCATWRRSSSA